MPIDRLFLLLPDGRQFRQILGRFEEILNIQADIVFSNDVFRGDISCVNDSKDTVFLAHLLKPRAGMALDDLGIGPGMASSMVTGRMLWSSGSNT